MTGEFTIESLLTSHQAGGLLQVNPSSINNWVKAGKIPAFRTPGGHRRIRAGDLVEFLEAHQMPVPKPLETAAFRRVMVVGGAAPDAPDLVAALRAAGSRIECRCVAQTIDALLEIGTFRPHLVVLDADALGPDALEVCRGLTSREETLGIRVFILCADITEALSNAATLAGAARCLSKPLDGAKLIDLVGTER